ncbi:hypothetical protein [uncultured Lentibacter sp.]|uniref:hypothetical protein n=1 Tax=uncultured Lentibacter sp. TaxID=1659309 RepID=UPI00263A306B|nr:hypothetical protein [uncultured Lentibacter sp.]
MPAPADARFVHVTQGRSRAALLTLGAVYGLLAALVWGIALSPVIVGVVALFTLPALWEYWKNPESRFEMDQQNLRWSTPRLQDEMPLGLILRARFDTRLDLSVRVTFLLKDNRKIRLPHACTPPHLALEQALRARAIPVERHHFSLIG